MKKRRSMLLKTTAVTEDVKTEKNFIILTEKVEKLTEIVNKQSKVINELKNIVVTNFESLIGKRLNLQSTFEDKSANNQFDRLDESVSDSIDHIEKEIKTIQNKNNSVDW